MIAGTVQTLLLLVSPFLQLCLGEILLERLKRFFPDTDQADEDDVSKPVAFILGLLVHLLLIFFLKQLSVPWVVAFFFPLVPVLIQPRRVFNMVLGFRVPPSFNFLLWFFIVISLGVSLFQVRDGIQTPWANNYGDLTFHLGMITSMVFGDNFPLEYHLFPGVRLSYPFLVNIWSASLWWISPTFKSLSFIFMYQWTVIWCLVFFLLRGGRYWALPWALLFGGGSYLVMDVYSWPELGKGYPWTVFLTTIWVTQRSSLLGLLSLLAALWMVQSAFEEAELSKRQRYLSIGGLILALSPLAHTHFCLVGILFVTLVLIFNCFTGAHPIRERVGELSVFLVSLAPAVVALPWLLGKKGITKPIVGWLVGKAPTETWLRLHECLKMWVGNAPFWIAIIALLWVVTRRHKEFLALTILFVAGNLVQLAAWDWDQLKIFIGLYIITISMWLTYRGRYLNLLCLALIVPGLVEAGKIFYKGEIFTPYNKKDVERAEVIRKLTPPRAVFAAKDKHNSLLTLTGRRIFKGFGGTLWSHDLPLETRKDVMETLDSVASCKLEGDVCPRYILWTDAEKKMWKKEVPGEGFTKLEHDYLYKIDKADG